MARSSSDTAENNIQYSHSPEPENSIRAAELPTKNASETRTIRQTATENPIFCRKSHLALSRPGLATTGAVKTAPSLHGNVVAPVYAIRITPPEPKSGVA